MDKKQALGKAMALCSRQEHSETEIREKLKFWEIPKEDIDVIVGKLITEKFIDDLRYAIAYARDKNRLNKWGRIKIRYMLSMGKVNPSTIDTALESIDEELYADALRDLLRKKSWELKNEPNPYTKRQKLIKFAQGRGFEVELIIRLVTDLT
jgi:regulatory protein